jgi:hypothetical protein
VIAVIGAAEYRASDQVGGFALRGGVEERE